jgi:hypothetical protein
MEAVIAPSPSIAQRIAATRLSALLKDELWVVPTSQSIHIIAVSLVFVSALLISLRLLGAGRSGRPVSVIVARHSRLMYTSLFVLLATGTLQTIAEPAREFHSPAFWIKMALIIFGLLLTMGLARSVRTDPQRWDRADERPAWSRPHALIYITAWTAIIVCGRFIAYT